MYEVQGGQVAGQINIAHNYATIENHYGQNVMVHRKGATLAREDTLGIIPGSQGTKSYIVRGLGNQESFESCSHGAGRKMGRKKAQKSLNLEEEKAKLDGQGIIHSIRTEKDLDEATGAYKDISEVMENQKDLVAIKETLNTTCCYKGVICQKNHILLKQSQHKKHFIILSMVMKKCVNVGINTIDTLIRMKICFLLVVNIVGVLDLNRYNTAWLNVQAGGCNPSYAG